MMTPVIPENESETVTTESEVHLPLGLLGFERTKRYTLLANPGEMPFRWLQVVGDPSLAFLVVPPFEVLPDYEPDISLEDAAFLELDSPEDALLFNIVTLRANGRATVNLKGPLVLNRYSLRGKQVVLANAADYALQHPLPVAD